MNYETIKEYLPRFYEALLLTLKIGWLGILLSLVLGIIGAAVIYFKVPIIRRIISIYIELYDKVTGILLYNLTSGIYQKYYRPRGKYHFPFKGNISFFYNKPYGPYVYSKRSYRNVCKDN